MFRSFMTIVRELYLYLTKVMFTLKHLVKLHIYILGDVAVCHREACVLFAVQNPQCTSRCTTCCHIT